jgi:hypothetical protein
VSYKRRLVLRVVVVEHDEEGEEVGTLCDHAEWYYGDDFLTMKEELLQCAYEGFDFARNKFSELPHKE